MIVSLNFTANRQILYCQFNSSFILLFSTFRLAQFQFRCKFWIAVLNIIQICLLRFCLHISLSDSDYFYFFIPFCFGLRNMFKCFQWSKERTRKDYYLFKISQHPSFVQYYFLIFMHTKRLIWLKRWKKSESIQHFIIWRHYKTSNIMLSINL